MQKRRCQDPTFQGHRRRRVVDHHISNLLCANFSAAPLRVFQRTSEAEERLRRANPAPDGTTALVTHSDDVAGAPGIASSWLQYPVAYQGAPGGEPALLDFDELRRQVTKWIKRVWSAPASDQVDQACVV